MIDTENMNFVTFYDRVADIRIKKFIYQNWFLIVDDTDDKRIYDWSERMDVQYILNINNWIIWFIARDDDDNREIFCTFEKNDITKYKLDRNICWEKWYKRKHWNINNEFFCNWNRIKINSATD